MIKKAQTKKVKYEVWEHLEHYVTKTTYAQRWKMLEEMREFFHRAVPEENKKIAQKLREKNL